jgi:hypothetical protein
MNLGAKDTWNYIRSLERIGSGYTGMRAILRKLREIMQIMSLLRMMIKILTRTGLSMPVSTLVCFDFSHNGHLWGDGVSKKRLPLVHLESLSFTGDEYKLLRL